MSSPKYGANESNSDENPEVAAYRRHQQWLRAMGQPTGPEISHVVSAVALEDVSIPKYERFGLSPIQQEFHPLISEQLNVTRCPTVAPYMSLSPIHEEFRDLIPEQLNVTGGASPEIPPGVVHSGSEYSADDDLKALRGSPKTLTSPITPITLPGIHPALNLIAPPEVHSPPFDLVAPPTTPLHPKDDGAMGMVTNEDIEMAIADTPLRSYKSKNIDGWLGNEQNSKGPVPTIRRSTIFLKELGKKFLKQDISDQLVVNDNGSPPPLPPKDRLITPPRPSPVSLAPGEQALLYSKLEFLICQTANAYLVQQYCDGRMNQNTINRVVNDWTAKNLPQVPEFRFDQATQRDLIDANRRTMEFTGSCSTNPIQLNANLRSWKSIIQDMNHRTFCLRDSVIRKHLWEIEQILSMLNAPIATLQAFDELRALILRHMNGRNYSSSSLRS